jgi:hypothetical protein
MKVRIAREDISKFVIDLRYHPSMDDWGLSNIQYGHRLVEMNGEWKLSSGFFHVFDYMKTNLFYEHQGVHLSVFLRKGEKVKTDGLDGCISFESAQLYTTKSRSEDEHR